MRWRAECSSAGRLQDTDIVETVASFQSIVAMAQERNERGSSLINHTLPALLLRVPRHSADACRTPTAVGECFTHGVQDTRESAGKLRTLFQGFEEDQQQQLHNNKRAKIDMMPLKAALQKDHSCLPQGLPPCHSHPQQLHICLHSG